LEKIVGSPQGIQGARAVGVEAGPGLSLPTPMQEADRAWMQVSAEASEVIPAKPVLVPPVIHRAYVASENE